MESKSHRSGASAKGYDNEDYHSAKPSYNIAEAKEVVVSKLSSSQARAEAKMREIEYEQEQDFRTDEEFENLKLAPQLVVPTVALNQTAKNFANGFKIISMNMRDASNGTEIWRSGVWDQSTMFDVEIEEYISKDILRCRAVAREIVFSSSEEIKKFRLEQRVFYRGTCIEEWFFTFGYVMAYSQNSWQQTIDAAPPSEMLPANVLSGNVVFETAFYDDKTFLCKNSVRIFYV